MRQPGRCSVSYLFSHEWTRTARVKTLDSCYSCSFVASPSLSQCDRLDLDLRPKMQVLDRNDRSRRPVIAHHAGVNLIDLAPQLDVRNVDRHLHHAIQT